MIKVLLAHHNGLLRAALAAVLDEQDGLEVVGQCGDGEGLRELLLAAVPDVAVLDFDLVTGPVTALCEQFGCRVLVVADRRAAACRSGQVAALAPRIGLIATDWGLDGLLGAVRKMAHGEAVLDSELARAALAALNNPLTEREREVLGLAEAGLTARDMAAKLFLSHGTVRNHLSRVLAKLGARTRIEAIRIARDKGWI